jgi:hypothetical protein
MVVCLYGSHAVSLHGAEALLQSASHVPDQVPLPDTSVVQPRCAVVRRGTFMLSRWKLIEVQHSASLRHGSWL